MVSPATLNCEHVLREISNYLDGDVDAALRSTMDEHFRTCKRCASVLAGTKNVVAAVRGRAHAGSACGFSRRLEKRLSRNTAATASRWSSWSAWLVPVAAIALIAIGLGLRSSFPFRNPPKSILSAPARDIPPDMLVVVSDGSKVFHVAGCPFIHDKASERTITAKQAMQDGYVPCSRCLRQYLKTGLVGPTEDNDDNVEAEDGLGEILSKAGH